MKKKILIGENNQESLVLLKNFFDQEFEITVCTTGEEVLKKALCQTFDILLINLILPNLNAIQILESLRKHSDIPVIIISQKDDEVDKVLAFKRGADDYIIKPCGIFEIKARIDNAIKKFKKVNISKSILTYNQIKIDCASRTASLYDKPLELTNTEFNILEILLKSPKQAFSKEELTEYALGRKFTAFDRSIDVHISNLRNKLGPNEDNDDIIKTVRGFGYCLN